VLLVADIEFALFCVSSLLQTNCRHKISLLFLVSTWDLISESVRGLVFCTVSRKQLFHQAVLMGGSDLCEWSIVDTIWNANALTYARDLGRLVGCGFDYDQSNEFLVDCLLKKHYEEMVNATASIPKRVCCCLVSCNLCS